MQVEEFCYIAKKTNNNKEINSSRIVESGEYEYIYFEHKDSNIDATYKQVKLLHNEETLNKILKGLNAVVVKIEMVEGVKIIYSFSPLLKGFVRNKWQKINLQFAINSGYVTVGYPVIYSGF